MDIESKIKEHEEILSKKSEQFNTICSDIKKLRIQKRQTIADINTLNGYLIGLKSVVESEKTKSVEAPKKKEK